MCLDPFHIVRWGTDALDVVRRWTWNVLRKIGVAGQAAQLKGCRYALWKNPDDLTDRQRTKLAWIARHNRTLYRAYLLKEHLRLVFQHRGTEAVGTRRSFEGSGGVRDRWAESVKMRWRPSPGTRWRSDGTPRRSGASARRRRSARTTRRSARTPPRTRRT